MNKKNYYAPETEEVQLCGEQRFLVATTMGAGESLTRSGSKETDGWDWENGNA